MSKWKRFTGVANGPLCLQSERDEALDLLDEWISSPYCPKWAGGLAREKTERLLDRLRAKSCPQCGQTNAVETEIRERRCPHCGGYVRDEPKKDKTVRERVQTQVMGLHGSREELARLVDALQPIIEAIEALESKERKSPSTAVSGPQEGLE